MALPKVLHPTKKIKIPSLDIELEFEPFTTADEKSIILMEKSASMYEKSKMQLDILQKCCKEGGEALRDLPVIEITYLFLQLRRISVGGTLEMVVECPECHHEIPVKVDINLIQFDPTNLKPLQFTVETDDGPYIVMASQFIVDDLQYINADEPGFDDVSLVLRRMMRPDGNDVIELTREEKIELFNQLDSTNAQKIVEYINNAPVLEKTLEITCTECEHQFKGELKDFFI